MWLGYVNNCICSICMISQFYVIDFEWSGKCPASPSLVIWGL